MLVRVLTELDVKQFWDLRLRALRENPEVFGASYEEEVNTTIDIRISRFNSEFIVPLKDNFILGHLVKIMILLIWLTLTEKDEQN